MDQDIEHLDGYVAQVSAVIEAKVEHVAPCTPDCPVCYPEGEGE